jgi:hypothetical protein
MRRFAFFWCAAILAGCAKSKDRPAEEATARTAVEAAAVPATSATISLGDVAGKWKMRATDEADGTVVEAVPVHAVQHHSRYALSQGMKNSSG